MYPTRVQAEKKNKIYYYIHVGKNPYPPNVFQGLEQFQLQVHSFSILSDDRSKASSKTMPPYSTMQSLLLQMRISSPVLKVIQ